MDVPWLSGLQMKSVSSFAALMCDFFFPQVKAVENLDTLFFWHLLQMPKYWQCLLFLFFPIWIPVITVKKVSCQFSINLLAVVLNHHFLIKDRWWCLYVYHHLLWIMIISTGLDFYFPYFLILISICLIQNVYEAIYWQ